MLAPLTRAGAGASESGSTRTVPVNQSVFPLLDGCEPLFLISILSFFLCVGEASGCARSIAGRPSAVAAAVVFRNVRREMGIDFRLLVGQANPPPEDESVFPGRFGLLRPERGN